MLAFIHYHSQFTFRILSLLDFNFIFILDELVHEKEKFKAISDELDQTFAEMSGY